METPLLVPVATFEGPAIRCTINGRTVLAFEGQSVLALLLSTGGHVRRHDVDGTPRAGFCLIGACQDCWVWLGPGRRGRACTTPVEAGMAICTGMQWDASHDG